MLQVVNLSAERHEQVLFNPLSFTVASGEALQIVGANGCGKTTLLRLLCGLSPLDIESTINWHGQSIQQNSKYSTERLYIGHQPGIRANLTVIENLQRMHVLYPSKGSIDIKMVLKTFNLQRYGDVAVGQLSAGQQRRAALARLLLQQAVIWILDEPFTALDNNISQFLQQLMISHVEQGGLLIFTSHQPVNLPGVNLQQLELHSCS